MFCLMVLWISSETCMYAILFFPNLHFQMKSQKYAINILNCIAKGNFYHFQDSSLKIGNVLLKIDIQIGPSDFSENFLLLHFNFIEKILNLCAACFA